MKQEIFNHYLFIHYQDILAIAPRNYLSQPAYGFCKKGFKFYVAWKANVNLWC